MRTRTGRPRVALFDYRIVPTNPVGSCHLKVLEGLCEAYDFTVFALEFDNPRPDRIRWVRIRVPSRPLALLFVMFHLVAPIAYLWQRRKQGARFDAVQMVESNLAFGDVCYSHFCHRSFLRRHWEESAPRGLRRPLRWLDHALHALAEPLVYRRARHVVVPSQGLRSELEAEYRVGGDRLEVIPNSVDLERYRRPEAFDRARARASLGCDPDDLVLVFVALGHFERKGLPQLLEALASISDARSKLLVVGGEPGVVGGYRVRAAQLGLDGRVTFTGMLDDIRPPLWASDAFVFPTAYEVFPLAALQAAAAGLPLVATHVNGIEEFLVEGRNGIGVERTPADLRRAVEKLSALSPGELADLGERAREDVARYGDDRFVAAWDRLYAEILR